MIQDDMKKNLHTDQNFLKNDIISKDSVENAVTDTIINNDSINKIVPVKQMEESLQQVESAKELIQSTLASTDNLSTEGLLNNELVKSQLPIKEIEKLTALKNNISLNDFSSSSIQSFKKSTLKQDAKETLSDTIAKTGLYFAVQVGDLALDTFDVVEFKLDEALSELFTLTMTLSSKDADIDLQNQLLEKTQFIVYSDGQKQRTINGIVEKAERGDSGFKRTYYTFIVRPLLWQLTLTKDSRIYHFKSVPDIIDEVLQNYHITFDKQLMDSHSVREYTTMKRESYYEFITRLAAEEGISFWFEEDKLFYSDSHLGMTGGPELIYNPHPQAATKELVINKLTFACAMRSTEVKTKDYRYSHPDVPMDAKRKTNKSLPVFETYDSYGRYHDEATAQQFSKYRLDALQADSESGQAASNSIQMMPGKIFSITEHPSKAMNNRWQIVKISHQGTLPQSLDNESDQRPATLTNQFTFIPGKNDWRPAFTHKPQADGDEIATVVGPDGEEIYVNEDGAVKVAFHWNRFDQRDENASCWVRVMQNWNGDGFGFLATPRIGQEVIISYLNGDLDRPIITGTVYNGNNRPPLNLPAEKTRMSIKSKTHKGEGFNELRFEDENGKQEVFIHAEKDMNVKVKNNKDERVDFNRTVSIGNNEEIAVANNRTLTVEGKQAHKTTGNFSAQVQGDKGLIIEGDFSQKINGFAGLDANGDLTLKSDSKITLRVGSSFIVVHSGGVDIKGPIINLNSGGSPGDTLIPARPDVLATAAGTGALFVEHCPLQEMNEIEFNKLLS